MNNEFIPYEPSFDLKELGFDEECLASYICHKEVRFDIQEQSGIRWHSVKNSEFEGGEHCTAPLYQQAFRWFREKYGLFGWIEGNEGKRIYMYKIESPIDSDDQLNCFPFKAYEEAELACLKKLIEIVKNK